MTTNGGVATSNKKSRQESVESEIISGSIEINKSGFKIGTINFVGFDPSYDVSLQNAKGEIMRGIFNNSELKSIPTEKKAAVINTAIHLIETEKRVVTLSFAFSGDGESDAIVMKNGNGIPSRDDLKKFIVRNKLASPEDVIEIWGQ